MPAQARQKWLGAYGDPRKPGVDRSTGWNDSLRRNSQLRPAVIENLCLSGSFGETEAVRRGLASSSQALTLGTLAPWHREKRASRLPDQTRKRDTALSAEHHDQQQVG